MISSGLSKNVICKMCLEISETNRQVHQLRKQCLINRDRHQHTTIKDMDSYQSTIGHMEVRPD